VKEKRQGQLFSPMPACLIDLHDDKIVGKGLSRMCLVDALLTQKVRLNSG
jgi:hypothetical protein